MQYSILDPTGNVTALVESEVELSRQPETAAEIMRLHPTVEQVGFLRGAGEDGLPELRMAGGEFCGNASMCAAGLLALRKGCADTQRLRVSGAARPVEVRLQATDGGSFRAEIIMPPAMEILEKDFRFEDMHAMLPLVRMEGISHLVIENTSPFFALLRDRETAERAVRAFCAVLGADGLGLLFLEGEGMERRMTPLVFVPGSGTVFWENSCASGSAAVGMALAANSGAAVQISLREPGGILHVTSDPATGETRLRGSVRFVARYTDG